MQRRGALGLRCLIIVNQQQINVAATRQAARAFWSSAPVRSSDAGAPQFERTTSQEIKDKLEGSQYQVLIPNSLQERKICCVSLFNCLSTLCAISNS